MSANKKITNVFEAILEYGHDEDFVPQESDEFVATDAPAGSDEKIETLIQKQNELKNNMSTSVVNAPATQQKTTHSVRSVSQIPPNQIPLPPGESPGSMPVAPAPKNPPARRSLVLVDKDPTDKPSSKTNTYSEVAGSRPKPFTKPLPARQSKITDYRSGKGNVSKAKTTSSPFEDSNPFSKLAEMNDSASSVDSAEVAVNHRHSQKRKEKKSHIENSRIQQRMLNIRGGRDLTAKLTPTRRPFTPTKKRYGKPTEAAPAKTLNQAMTNPRDSPSNSRPATPNNNNPTDVVMSDPEGQETEGPEIDPRDPLQLSQENQTHAKTTPPTGTSSSHKVSFVIRPRGDKRVMAPQEFTDIQNWLGEICVERGVICYAQHRSPMDGHVEIRLGSEEDGGVVGELLANDPFPNMQYALSKKVTLISQCSITLFPGVPIKYTADQLLADLIGRNRLPGSANRAIIDNVDMGEKGSQRRLFFIPDRIMLKELQQYRPEKKRKLLIAASKSFAYFTKIIPPAHNVDTQNSPNHE